MRKEYEGPAGLAESVQSVSSPIDTIGINPFLPKFENIKELEDEKN